MPQVVINNKNRPFDPPVIATYCASFLCRLRGLTFRRHLPSNFGILLVETRDSRIESSIHMLFTWIKLAVVWINTQGEIVDVKMAYPWRLAYFPQKPARYVLELSETHINNFQVGEYVSIETVSK
jgi:uncharacterized membrane protein (UPF0127 family)